MENINDYKDLVKELTEYRIETRKRDQYVYKSHIVIITYHGESYSTMLYDYQLDGVINLFANSTNVINGINIQIYEIGRTVYRNF